MKSCYQRSTVRRHGWLNMQKQLINSFFEKVHFSSPNKYFAVESSEKGFGNKKIIAWTIFGVDLVLKRALHLKLVW